MLGTYISPLNSFPAPYSFKRQIKRTSASGTQERCSSQAASELRSSHLQDTCPTAQATGQFSSLKVNFREGCSVRLRFQCAVPSTVYPILRLYLSVSTDKLYV